MNMESLNTSNNTFGHYTDDELIRFIRQFPGDLIAEGELVRRVVHDQLERAETKQLEGRVEELEGEVEDLNDSRREMISAISIEA